MPSCYHKFLNEIEDYKKLHGFLTQDDEYRKKFWLPDLPVDHRAEYLKSLRQNWKPNTDIKLPSNRFSLGVIEKPTRLVDKGSILGVGKLTPMYVNRNSAVAKEFQGARIGTDYEVGPEYPFYIPLGTANYLMRRNPLTHRDCLDAEKNSATLWRDLINATLENKVISGVHRWNHPLIATAKERFDQRWPTESRQKYPDLYCHEFCKLFLTPSRVFVLDWIDEQLTFPREDYRDP